MADASVAVENAVAGGKPTKHQTPNTKHQTPNPKPQTPKPKTQNLNPKFPTSRPQPRTPHTQHAQRQTDTATWIRVRIRVATGPQKALCGGIPDPFLEPLTRSWSHFVGIYCQKLTSSLVDRLLRYPHEGPCVVFRGPHSWPASKVGHSLEQNVRCLRF